MRKIQVHCLCGLGLLALIAIAAQAQTVLYNFGSKAGDPLQPSYSGIVAQGRDGNLYTTSVSGGTGTGGTVFKITPTGKLKVLYNFDSIHGATPYSGLTLGSDGRFYGTATTAGTFCCGTFTLLYTFDQTTGAYPLVTLTQHANGAMYADTQRGGLGPDSCPFGVCSGVFYRLDGGLDPFVTLLPPSAKAGRTIGVLGQGFKGTTAVIFGGVSANFKVVLDTYVTATVPSGGGRGFVTVSTSGGTVTSKKEFVLLP